MSGWLVRYEITGGPPAGFSPDGGPVIEVAVDEQGRGGEIIQPQPLAGTNQISIQVIRRPPRMPRAAACRGDRFHAEDVGRYRHANPQRGCRTNLPLGPPRL